MGQCFSSHQSKNKCRLLKHLKRLKQQISETFTDTDDHMQREFLILRDLPEVLESVLSVLDADSLSKEWNHEALRILAKRSCISIDMQSSIESNLLKPKSTGTLPRSITESESPKQQITNIPVPFGSIEDRRRMVEIIQEFGIHVKSLHLRGFSPERIKKVLACWCPNLTSLSLTAPPGNHPSFMENHQKFKYFNHARYITTLELKGCLGKVDVHPDSEEFAMFLIRYCPKLKSLKLCSPFQDFRKLAWYPRIVGKLEKFTWTHSKNNVFTCACGDLKYISSLKFSKKLTHLELNFNVQQLDANCLRMLCQFLGSISSHLEFLKISVAYYSPTSRIVRCREAQFLVPEMEKLKVLIQEGINVFGLDSFQVLQKCPNLVKFLLSQRIRCGRLHITYIIFNDVGMMCDLELDLTRSAPLVSLKELFIYDRCFLKVSEFEVFPKGFPTLISLLVCKDGEASKIQLLSEQVTKRILLIDVTLAIHIGFLRVKDLLRWLPILLENCKPDLQLRTLSIFNSSLMLDRKPKLGSGSTWQDVWDALSPMKDMNCDFTFKNFPMKEGEERILLSIAKENGMRLNWDYETGNSNPNKPPCTFCSLVSSLY